MGSSNFCGSLPGIWTMVGDFLGRRIHQETPCIALDEDIIVLPYRPRVEQDQSMILDEKIKVDSYPPSYIASIQNQKVESVAGPTRPASLRSSIDICELFAEASTRIEAENLSHRGAFFKISPMGWFQPDTYLSQRVWQTFKDTPRNKLRELFFHRENRSTFGQNFKNASAHSRDKQHRGSINNSSGHPAQERQRRDRHRVLQRLNDEFTPTAIWNLAQSLISIVRRELPWYYPDDFESVPAISLEQQSSETSARGPNSRKIECAKGKDEQLLSSAMFPSFAAIVVQSEIAHSEKLEIALEETLKKEKYLEDLLAEKDRILREKDMIIAELQRNAGSRIISPIYTPTPSVSPRPGKRTLEDDYEIVASVEPTAPKRRLTDFNVPFESRINHPSSPSPSN